MFEVEIYGRVRRAVRVEGRSQRAVAREFGLSRETVRKMLQFAVPPGYQRQQPIRRPKLGPWLGVIDAILEDDKQRPAKQRHTAKRIFERLKEEHGFTGRYTIVKDYVRTAMLRRQEMFVPLVHPAGEAQVDFGEVLVVIAGVEQKAHYLAMDLPQSDDCFVAAFPAETTEAFLEGHVRAFAYFGGVPTRILYDNTMIAVAKIPARNGNGRGPSPSCRVNYLFADKYGRPARGNDKGKVEGLVGYARRNFMVPIPRVSGWQELNAHLEAECRKRRERRLHGHTETIGERFERDRAALLPLPAGPVRSLREDLRASQFAVAGPLSLERLLGAHRVRASPGMGEGLRARSGDRLRQRSHRPESGVLHLPRLVIGDGKGRVNSRHL
jgi:transposase